jgi:hypothetical protein
MEVEEVAMLHRQYVLVQVLVFQIITEKVR